MGMKLTATLIKLRPVNFNKVMYDELKQVFGKAALAFITEAAKHVAVDTGMSLASLTSAAEQMGVESGVIGAASLIAIAPRRGPRPGYVPPELPYRSGSTDMSRYKSIKEGIAAGKDTAKITVGSPANPVFTFDFSINVFQYMYWEALWNSTSYGAEAFERTLREESIDILDKIAASAFEVVRIE